MDVAHYRRSETNARQHLVTWRDAEAQRPTWFERVGFPTRVDSSADLVQLVDTMQEGRFAAYQAELGGLSDTDVGALAGALASFARFFAAAFDAPRAPLPLDTMMAHYALATKLRGYLAGWPGRVLEIGPGCGYLSFFADLVPLAHYVQIENTESFYLLQHLVNAHCFGLRHRDHAAQGIAGPGEGVPERLAAPICEHVPWWRLRWSGSGLEGPFDIVTANANLTEMTDAALTRYAALAARTLTPKGALIVQCTGAGMERWPRVLDVLKAEGFAPLVHAFQEFAAVKPFCLPNALFVRAGHEAYGRTSWEHNQFDADDPVVRRVYLPPDTAPRREWSVAEVVDRVRTALAGAA